MIADDENASSSAPLQTAIRTTTLKVHGHLPMSSGNPRKAGRPSRPVLTDDQLHGGLLLPVLSLSYKLRFDDKKPLIINLPCLAQISQDTIGPL